MHFKQGEFYRLTDLNNLKPLLADGILQKVGPRLYYCPEQSRFGAVPPEAHALIKAFLKTDQFLLFSFNVYNQLGIGTTQLYNETIVYNHQRHGKIKLANRKFTFKRKLNFPLKLTIEYLVVDLVNNNHLIAEDPVAILENVKRTVLMMDQTILTDNLARYGSAKTKRMFSFL
ncbi:MAG: hypothetical protein V4539_01120 [Bacteroidota bacterium]